MSRLRSPAAHTAAEPRSEPRATARTKRPKNGTTRAVGAFVAIGLASLSGPALLLLNSPHGIHVTYDSFTYLGAASNLAHGQGWTYPFNAPGAPVTLFPPLFPVVLALSNLLGADPLTWALHESALLFWSLLMIVGLGVYRATERSLPAALAGVCLGALGLPQLFVYSNVWSETLFFPLELVALFLLGGFFGTRRTRYLVLAAAATALAMLTRYMGLSLFLWSCLLLALWPGRSVLKRLRILAIFTAISLAPIGVWLVRNQIESGTLTGNNHLVGAPSGPQAIRGLKVVWAWFFLPGRRDPYGLSMFALLALAVLVGSLVAIVAARGRWGVLRVPAAAVVMLSFPIGHFLFIAAANAFSDRVPPFNNRMLGPTYLPLSLGVLILGWALWGAEGGRWSFARPVLRAVLALGLVSLLLTLGAIAKAHVSSPATLAAFDQSAEGLNDLGSWLGPQIGSSDAVVYGSPANVAWFVSGSPVISLPLACAGNVEAPAATYQSQLNALGQELAGHRVVAVVFVGQPSGFGSPVCPSFSLAQLKDALHVEQTHQQGALIVLTGGG